MKLVALVLPLLLLGCSQEKLPLVADIPPSAIDVKEGDGRLFYEAAGEGVIYLYDVNIATVILTQPIVPPQRFILNQTTGLVTVEGRPTYADPTRYSIKFGDTSIKEVPITQHHTYRIYFVPENVSRLLPPTTRP